MKSYLYAVQDENGREIVSWKGEVEKVGDVTVYRSGGTVYLQRAEEGLASGHTDQDGELHLLRWPADDKLSEPVRRKIN